MFNGVTFFGIVHQSGGCGPELLGAIDLLQSKGVAVRCITHAGDRVAYGDRSKYLKSRGVEVSEYTPGAFSQCKVVVSFCEGDMFKYILQNCDRPLWTVWSGAMSWALDKEVSAHAEGLIDETFFYTERVAKKVLADISIRTGKTPYYRSGYLAHINPSSDYAQYMAHINKCSSEFWVFKATRNDSQKWHPYHWRMCAAVTAPLEKKIHFEVVGWGDAAKKRVGDPCDPSSQWSNRFNLNIHGHIVNPVTMAQLYGKSHVLLHYYPFIESFGFATLQAMLAKCVPVGAAEGGFLDLIRHGDTGYLARCPEEAAYYTSKLAFEDATWRKMSEAAAKWVVEEGPGNPDKCWPWWEELLKSREISFIG